MHGSITGTSVDGQSARLGRLVLAAGEPTTTSTRAGDPCSKEPSAASEPAPGLNVRTYFPTPHKGSATREDEPKGLLVMTTPASMPNLCGGWAIGAPLGDLVVNS